jgi:hypothetical protein
MAETHEAPDLRERLLAMRASLVDGMAAAPHLDGGHLALLGHVGAALAAVDAESTTHKVKLEPATGRSTNNDPRRNLYSEYKLSGADYKLAPDAEPTQIKSELSHIAPAVAPAVASERAAVADDGHSIILTIYRGPDALAAVALPPARALWLAGELLAAGLRHGAIAR